MAGLGAPRAGVQSGPVAPAGGLEQGLSSAPGLLEVCGHLVEYDIGFFSITSKRKLEHSRCQQT